MPRREYQSRQVIMCLILDYLYSRESEIGSVTKHHIMTKTPEIHEQTSGRISEILDEMVKRGLLVKTPSGDWVLYKISEKGKMNYKEWMRPMLVFFGYPTVKLTKPKLP